MSYSSFTTASSSSPLTYPRKFSDSISFSNKFVLIRFPKTHILSSTKIQQKPGFGRSKAAHFTTMATTGSKQEVLPPAFTSTSDPPPVFDGNTRLYISYQCPYAQRVWITRNVKGLQEKIQLVPIDLKDRPSWYKEKVYPDNKVPSLEHNNKVIGESLDLIKYIDSQFKGPSLFPDDPARIEFAEELLSQSGSVHKSVTSSFKGEVEESGAAFDYIETALSKFEDGPFFLGQFSLVDIAYAPFIERYQLFLLDVKKYDITEGRPKLKAWIEEINKIEGYRQTRNDPKELVESYKKRFLVQV
ncbi:hypothetical protein FEM48_Zijuj03G0081600 [Ziziphus jujuba var. spinosa]|uniref:glutathione transferase n=1 Tax=Ziziphus jujuba var. spinosa TaxID=714518 RepID=A0A978VP60_ZIZJJ|nr:hypothetical protein FEM48_Zijuj03G0081600 [Ziziphus jujuba var. spinosa]